MLRRYPLLFWLQGLQANIGIMMFLRGWNNAISAEGWLVSPCWLVAVSSCHDDAVRLWCVSTLCTA